MKYFVYKFMDRLKQACLHIEAILYLYHSLSILSK